MADPLSVLFVQNPGRRVSIGSITLDATILESHEYSAEVTNHPIETGGFVTDHIYENPRIVSIEGHITDSPVVFFTDLGGISKRSVEAHDQLVALYQSRNIVSVVTGLKIYSDMVIENLTFPKNQQTGRKLEFRAQFKEIKTAQSQIIGIAEEKAAPDYKDKVSTSKDVGRQETVDTTESQEVKAEAQSELYRQGVFLGDILGF